MNEPLIRLLDRLLARKDLRETSFDDIYTELMEPTLNDLEAFKEEETLLLQEAHDYLDEHLAGNSDIDSAAALHHAAQFLEEKGRDFSEVANKFEEFSASAEELGYLEEKHDSFFLAVLHYLRTIKLDDVAYRVREEEKAMEHLDVDAVVEHVRGIIDNDYYAVDHGLQDVRRGYAEALLD